MSHSRNNNNKVTPLHEKALRIAYKNKSSSFQDFLDRDNSVTIHHRNIRTLATGTYEVQQGLSPPSLNEVFVERDCNYNLQRNYFLNRRRVKSVRYDTETISYLASKFWPKEIKDFETLNTFKTDFAKHLYRK